MWTKIKTDNMETPLESNKFIGERKKAIDAGENSFVVNGKTYKVTGSPAAMSYNSPAKQMQPIVDPMTGMPVVPAQSANNVFPPQTQQVAGQMFGQQMPGMYGSALAKKGCKYKK